MLAGFDPTSPDQIADPFPTLALAREEQPVFYVPQLNMWWVTRHDDVEEALRDTATFSSAKVTTPPQLPEEIAAELPGGYPLNSAPIGLDPPEHTRLRKLAQKAFTARQAELHAGTVRELANRLIDEFIDDGEVDLVEPFCMAIPIRILGPFLGISMDEAAQLREWGIGTQTIVVNQALLSHDDLLEAGSAPVALDRFVRALIAERRAAPRDEKDLVTSLICAQTDDGGSLLSDDEIVGILTNSINGASDTSTATMGYCVRSLLEERSRWEAILAEPDLIENAIEEALRLGGPVWVMRRDTTRECVLGGATIPAGAMVGLHFGSGGRDASVFPDPERFDLERLNSKRHFGLGRGTHFCLGGALARMLLRESIGTLAQRLPSLRLVPGHELEHATSFAFNMLRGGLVVAWDERS
jgi:hypothetical protein